MPSDPVTHVQRYYPQIYLACHVDHVRALSTEHRLSAQDSSLLAHVDTDEPILAGELAKHLAVAPSTLSATIKRLVELGYLDRRHRLRDRRHVELRLTPKGAEAMAATSVLDRDRVKGVLLQLSPAARRRAVSGLKLLATAARRYQLKQPRRKIRS